MREIPEGAAARRARGLFAPVGITVTLQQDEHLDGVDFVITDIGSEAVEGPETDASDIDVLPDSGAAGSDRASASGDDASVPLLVLGLGAGLAACALGGGLMLLARRHAGNRP